MSYGLELSHHAKKTLKLLDKVTITLQGSRKIKGDTRDGSDTRGQRRYTLKKLTIFIGYPSSDQAFPVDWLNICANMNKETEYKDNIP
jgi:hypothetical protein